MTPLRALTGSEIRMVSPDREWPLVQFVAEADSSVCNRSTAIHYMYD